MVTKKFTYRYLIYNDQPIIGFVIQTWLNDTKISKIYSDTRIKFLQFSNLLRTKKKKRSLDYKGINIY